MEGWRHGLATGGGEDWAARVAQLRDYQREHGDAHAGYRASDDAELGRWAAAQRAAAAEGRLLADRCTAGPLRTDDQMHAVPAVWRHCSII